MKEILVGMGAIVGGALAGLIAIILVGALLIGASNFLEPYPNVKISIKWTLKVALAAFLVGFFLLGAYGIGFDLLNP